MAPGNNERHSSHSGHTGTIPKTKARNNCNVPQEAVTPTRRDMTTNLASTSLDWVPVSEYNTRGNYNQSRKPANNSSDHELTDLDNTVAFESGFGRFVPVRPQPRALPLNVQNQNIASDYQEDGGSSSASGQMLHPYAHQIQNGLNPHNNHTAAAVMIVNPTTPNAISDNINQPYNAPHQNRNNLTRNLNPARNNLEGHSHMSNNSTPPMSNSRSGTKSVNLMNNMYDQGQSSFNNINDNHVQMHRESARTLGEAIVAACPDAAAVERRLGQIREYIRVTSSLVDTMRNSEDEAFIEHTKEEYDELVEMVMKLKESESKLENILSEKVPDNVEVPADENHSDLNIVEVVDEVPPSKTLIVNNNDTVSISSNLKKVTNIENEQLNKTLHIVKASEDNIHGSTVVDTNSLSQISEQPENQDVVVGCESSMQEIVETSTETETKKADQHLNELLKQNILACVEKVALMEDLKNKKDSNSNQEQEVVVRPVSAQSNGSAYSENELWQNEIKNKMEMSQLRLSSLKQQQKRLIKYQEEAKQQLEEMTRDRQSQDLHNPSSSHDNFGGMQNQPHGSNYHHSNRMYAANQIGVATTLPHSIDSVHCQQNLENNMDNHHGHSSRSVHSQEEQFSHRDANIASSEEAAGGRDSDGEEGEELLSERARILQMKLRELQMKKQHMENLVSEFQKLQMATRGTSSQNTYSSSGEDSGVEESSCKFAANKQGGSIKNDDPFKLMEIKAIKTALQKTKDLMRSVENYETEHLESNHDEGYQMSCQSNLNDNKSEGGGSMGGWSNEGSVCRVRNSLQPHKFTNTQQQQHQHQHQHQQNQHQHQHQQNQHQQHQQQHDPQRHSHQENIAALQELSQDLRRETEKIMGERARIKEVISNKELGRKQKKVNSDGGASVGAGPGPAERRQMQLRALLAEKQRELEALLRSSNEKIMGSGGDNQNQKQDSRAASIVNQSYTSEQEEPESHSEQNTMDSQNLRENDSYRGGADSSTRSRTINTLPSHMGSAYGSDSDSAARGKSNQRNRTRRRQTQERLPEECTSLGSNQTQNTRLESRAEQSNINMVPPISQNENPGTNTSYPYPPCWDPTKSNQDMRNQFTQNSQSQTMERLLGTPQMSFSPSMPYNMMMPYGVMGGCGCGCGVWGPWYWQQLAMHQRDIHQLREQINHLEERWRAESASHMLNNQVPPGNRANNYWDNFRSYSRQNLLSGSSKTNAEGQRGGGGSGNGAQSGGAGDRGHKVARRGPPAGGAATAKRNAEPPCAPPAELARHSNVALERAVSFCSPPDVLNVNQPQETSAPPPATSRHFEEAAFSVNVTDVNLNRQEPSSSFRNLNITNPIPEIIQAHSNNLTASAMCKKKSSSKLPAKNSANRRNLDYSQTSNINIASTSEEPNPNLASTSRDVQDKATSKLFDLLRENVYSEVTTLIGVNESHPDFLIQLFRELQLISSDSLRQKVLQSIRNVLSQINNVAESGSSEHLENRIDTVTTTSNEANDYHENDMSSTTHNIDNKIIRFLLSKSDEICTPELLDTVISLLLGNNGDSRQLQQSKKKLYDILSKYEGLRLCDVSSEIIENLNAFGYNSNEGDESTQLTSEVSEASILQDVAGSLNLFGTNEPQSNQHNACPYDMWPAHVHVDMEPADLNDNSARSSQDDKVDLINCSEIHNGDLAEADQTCHQEMGNSASSSPEEGGNCDTLPDVVDADEATPTEAEAEWLGLDRVPTRLQMESSEKRKD